MVENPNIDMKITAPRVAPVIPIQKEMLTEFLQRNEQLLSGKFSSEFTKKQGQQLWIEVTSMLNAIPGGSKKTWVQWRKTWQDMKKNVKSKAVAEKRYATQTGGGPLKVIKFDDTENKILNILSPKATFGDILVPVPNVSFDFVQSSPNAALAASESSDETLHPPINPLFESETLDKDQESITLIVEKEAETTETPKKLLPKQRKPLAKSKRLQDSIDVSKQLVKIEEEKKKEIIKYYEEKKNYIIWRMKYEKEKLQYLKMSVGIKENILKEIREIKEYYLSC